MSINRSIAFIDGKVTYKAPKTASSRRLIALSPDSCVVLREHRANQDAIRAELDLKPAKMEDSDLVFCWIDTKEPLLPDCDNSRMGSFSQTLRPRWYPVARCAT